ncbi:hypothetical protein BKA93DRAFT_614978 [Sparassis latifolia]
MHKHTPLVEVFTKLNQDVRRPTFHSTRPTSSEWREQLQVHPFSASARACGVPPSRHSIPPNHVSGNMTPYPVSSIPGAHASASARTVTARGVCCSSTRSPRHAPRPIGLYLCSDESQCDNSTPPPEDSNHSVVPEEPVRT